MALDDNTLREAATHRGLKLVKSRKRKRGVGDYGLFGLTDAAGKALFGIGDDGFTATAQDIADYLRKGEASTWAASAKVTPSPARRVTADAAPAADEDPPSAIRPRRRHAGGAAPASNDRRGQKADADTASSKGPYRRSASPTQKAPKPRPELVIRAARPTDSGAIRALLAQTGFEGTTRAVSRAVAEASARGEPILVADRGGVLGCLAWHVVPMLDRAPIGWITAIVVDENTRRAGIGRALYEAAKTQLAKRQITSVEMMSDIAIRNLNGFMRKLGLEQASYRFVASLS